MVEANSDGTVADIKKREPIYGTVLGKPTRVVRVICVDKAAGRLRYSPQEIINVLRGWFRDAVQRTLRSLRFGNRRSLGFLHVVFQRLGNMALCAKKQLPQCTVNLTKLGFEFGGSAMAYRDPVYRRHRFSAEIIVHAVWLYFRLPLSLRVVEDVLAARG